MDPPRALAENMFVDDFADLAPLAATAAPSQEQQQQEPPRGDAEMAEDGDRRADACDAEEAAILAAADAEALAAEVAAAEAAAVAAAEAAAATAANVPFPRPLPAFAARTTALPIQDVHGNTHYVYDALCAVPLLESYGSRHNLMYVRCHLALGLVGQHLEPGIGARLVLDDVRCIDPHGFVRSRTVSCTRSEVSRYVLRDTGIKEFYQDLRRIPQYATFQPGPTALFYTDALQQLCLAGIPEVSPDLAARLRRWDPRHDA